MHANPADRLVMMANQIAKNLEIQGEDRAVAEMSSHIKRYWEPRMRATMKSYIEADGSALSPLATKALHVIWPDVKPGQGIAAAKPATKPAGGSGPGKKAAAKSK